MIRNELQAVRDACLLVWSRRRAEAEYALDEYMAGRASWELVLNARVARDRASALWGEAWRSCQRGGERWRKGNG